MVKYEIKYNRKKENYTLDDEFEGIKSEKKVPMKYKVEDSTSKFRKEILKKEIKKENNKN